MFDRIKAKEKSKTLIRTRNLADAVGFGAIRLAVLFFAAVAVFAALSIPGLFAGTSALFQIGIANSLSMLAALPVIIAVAAGVWFINLLFTAGMNRAALRMNRGDKNVRVIDTALAGDRLGSYIKISLWQSLILFLWNLPSTVLVSIAVGVTLNEVFSIVGGIGALVGLTGAFGGLIALAIIIAIFVWNFYFFSWSIWSIPSALIFLISMVDLAIDINNASVTISVLLIIAALAWSVFITQYKKCQYYFSYCVSEDNRDMRALYCIIESGRLTSECKSELFITMLSFIGWDFVAWSFIGSVFVLPYHYMTYTSVYEQLTETFKPANRANMLWLNNSPTQASGESASGERAVEILSGEFAGSVLPVKAGEDITIGRDPKRSNVVVSSSNTAISGLHCTIRYNDQLGRYIIIDHSSNGTYINNEKLQQEKPAHAPKNSLIKLADGAMVLRLS